MVGIGDWLIAVDYEVYKIGTRRKVKTFDLTYECPPIIYLR